MSINISKVKDGTDHNDEFNEVNKVDDINTTDAFDEVDEFDPARPPVQLDVLWADVAVHDPVGVQVFQRPQELPRDRLEHGAPSWRGH